MGPFCKSVLFFTPLQNEGQSSMQNKDRGWASEWAGRVMDLKASIKEDRRQIEPLTAFFPYSLFGTTREPVM